MTAELAFRDAGVLGESPVWDAHHERLWWVDVHGRRLLYAGSGAVEERRLDRVISSFALTSAGEVVGTAKRALVAIRPDGDIELLREVWPSGASGERFNDGKPDPAGRFWAGTIAGPEQGRTGRLYRFDEDGACVPVLTGVGISNGIAWSPDGVIMYYVDSSTQAVDALDFDPAGGTAGRRRRFVRIDERLGLPDGIAVDADGGVWVALFFGSVVHRYTPDGRLDRVVRLPLAGVTSVAFGGADLSTLFITTGHVAEGPQARRFGANPADPTGLAGSVFACTPGVAGAPVAHVRDYGAG